MSASDPSAATAERYRSIVETAVDAIITIDEAGTVESLNAAAERIFGYAAPDVVGRNVRMLMPEPHRSRHDGYLGRYLAGGDPRIIGVGRDVTGLRRDGTTFPMHLAVGEMVVEGRRMFTGVVRDITERVQAEERLRASEARNRAIIETAVDGIISITASGLVDSFNAAAERIFGYGADEVIGQNVRMLMPEPDRSRHDGYLARYLAGGDPRIIGVGREVTGRRKDGTTFPMRLAVSEMHIGDERMFTGIVRDISDVKLAEQAIQREREYASALVESMQDGLVVRDLEGRIIQVNRRFCEMTGFGASELIGLSPPFPYWLEGSGDPLDEVRVHGHQEADVLFRRRDGGPLAVIIAAAPVHDARGRLTLYVETVKDITERRRNEGRAEAVVAALQDGMIVHALDGTIVQVNRRFCEMTGFGAGELVGRQPPFPYWPDRTVDPMSAVGSRTGGEADARLSRRDGSPLDVIVTVAPVHDARGQLTLYVETVKDVTERRQQEAALLESETQLGAAREAQRLTDEFVALVSHELRTPLTAVMGYLQLVLQDEPGLDAEARELLEIAERNGRRLQALVDDLLLLARADAGRLRLSLRRLALADLVEQAVEAARPAARSRGIALAHEIAPTPPVEADPDRLAQLLDNLVSNALKFTPQGGEVRVALNADQDRARLTVTDTGPGIPEAEQARLFERFYRASQATTQMIPGSGLGLAVVKAIAEAHGGRVFVDSAEGRGSTFWLELPLLAEPVVAPLRASG